MSKYEKQAWTTGIYMSLVGVALFVGGWNELFVGVILGFIIVGNLWYCPFEKCTETEIRYSYKATALTCYGALVVAFILLVFSRLLFPEEISRLAIEKALLHFLIVVVGVGYILLAYFLRKERLSRAAGYRPHPNPLPEGEGKDDHIT